MDSVFDYGSGLLFSAPPFAITTTTTTTTPATIATPPLLFSEPPKENEEEDWSTMFNNLIDTTSRNKNIAINEDGGLEDGILITDFLNSNSVTSIASSFLSSSPSSSPTFPTTPIETQQQQKVAAPFVEMMWKPAKARKDTFSATFPEKMMIRPYKYDLLVRSNRKHLVENMSLEMVFADTFERPVSTKAGIIIEKDLLLGSGNGRLFRFKMNLCSFHFGRRDFRICIACGNSSDGTDQHFYSEPFHTFARKREPKTTTSPSVSNTIINSSGSASGDITASATSLLVKRRYSSLFSNFLAALPSQQQQQSPATTTTTSLSSSSLFDEEHVISSPQSTCSNSSSNSNDYATRPLSSSSSTTTTKRIKLMNDSFATPVWSPLQFDTATQILTVFSSMSSADKVTFATSLFTLLTPEEREQVV